MQANAAGHSARMESLGKDYKRLSADARQEAKRLMATAFEAGTLVS